MNLAIYFGWGDILVPKPQAPQLLEAIDSATPVRAYIEIADPTARLELPTHPLAEIEWLVLPTGAAVGTSLLSAVERAELPAEAHIWCAGEAAAMHAIRNHLFKERGVARSQATVRGYWKAGR